MGVADDTFKRNSKCEWVKHLNSPQFSYLGGGGSYASNYFAALLTLMASRMNITIQTSKTIQLFEGK